MLNPSESFESGDVRQLAIVAHELRNPVAAASGALRMLERTAARVPEINQPLQIVQRQLDHVSRLVDDLVDAASVLTGMLSLHKEPVDLSQVLLRAVQSCRHSIDAGGHQLEIVCRDTLLVHADAQRLTQVFVNLLDNAVKYSEPRGRISVTAECGADAAVVVVQDNGIGIRPDIIPRIFDFFVQGGTPLTGSTRGLGIGLALAKQVVEGHGGVIEASSAGIGFGSSFCVRIPLVRAQATQRTQ